MKFYLINTVAAFLILFAGVSAQGVLLNDYTTIDVPGANDTVTYGIDASMSSDTTPTTAALTASSPPSPNLPHSRCSSSLSEPNTH